MILLDTSVWVNHLRQGNPEVSTLLSDGEVVCHPFIIGELACGNIKNRHEILALLHDLPSCPTIEQDEFIAFIEHNQLSGLGLGFVDVHLLASARLAGIPLWTADRILARVAEQLHLGGKE